jgi:CHAT domain-containing protein/lipoprotein NlpI
VSSNALAPLLVLCWAAASGAAPADTTAEKAVPAYVGIRRLLGAGQYAKAVEKAHAAARLEPRSFRVYEAMVEGYRGLNALPQAQQDLAARVEQDPENPALHYGLGLAQQNAKEDARALESFRRTIALAPEFALAYRELAYEHQQLATLGDAAAELEGDVADHPDHANAHYALGFVYSFQGDQARALEHLDRALALDPGLLDAYRYAGQLRLAAGDFETSLELSRELLRRADALADPVYRGFACNALGNASLRLADYANGAGYYLDALATQRQLGDRQGQWSTLNGLGVLYDSLGVSARARAFYSEALTLAQGLENPRWKATSLHNLGVWHARQGQWSEARRNYMRALAIRTQLKDPREVAYTQAEIGISYVRQQRPAEGLRALEEAERGAAAVEDGYLRAVVQTALAEASERHATEAEAGERYSQALQLAERLHQRELIWRAQRGLGAVRLRQGRLEEALEHYVQAVDTIEGIRQQLQDESGRMLFLERRLAAFEGIVALLHRLHERAPDAGYDRRALEYAQRAKARAFLELLAEAKADVRRGMSATQRKEEQAILRDTTRIQRALLQRGVADERRKALEAELSAVEGRRERFEDELRRTSPQYAALRYPQAEPLAGLQARLPGRSLLIEFMIAEERSFAWLVSDHDVRMVALPGRAALEAKVARYAALLARPPTRADAPAEATAQGRDLFRILLAPFADALAQAQRLLIVPDGVLHYLPLESLVSAVDAAGRPRYLLETHDVAYLPSANALGDLGPRSRPADQLELLAYGAPELPAAGTGPRSATRPEEQVRGFLGEPGLDLGPLPQARHEVEAIARLFPESLRKVRVGAGASETAFKGEELQRYRILHFATHGLMDDQAPSRSGLLLAAGGPEQDGLLQGTEILNLKLDADLVVLSACRTGLGRLVRGEGMVGLSRSFFYAGARSLLVSLWSVNDQSTAEIMESFYRRLHAGSGTASALREAKRALLRSERPAYRFPYYWAPFVLLGRGD